jgi:hypothetical protein
MKKEGVCGMDAATQRPHIVVRLRCGTTGKRFDTVSQNVGYSGQWKLKPPFSAGCIGCTKAEFAFGCIETAGVMWSLEPIVRLVGSPLRLGPFLGKDLTADFAKLVIDDERVVRNFDHWSVQQNNCPT